MIMGDPGSRKTLKTPRMDLLYKKETPAAAKVQPSSVRGYALLEFALPTFLSLCWNGLRGLGDGE